VDARLIGIISKAHGLKGEVVIELLTDYPNTIKRGSSLFFDEKCTAKAKVENIKYFKSKENKSFFIIKFKDIENRDLAEELRGRHVFRRRKSMPTLKKNQYLIDDIKGCRVYSVGGTFVGIVLDVEKFVSNDNLVVKIENDRLDIKGNKEKIFYVPVIKDYIDTIDLDDKKVVLKRIPEYI